MKKKNTNFEQLESFRFGGEGGGSVIDILHRLQEFVVPGQAPLLLLEKVLVSVPEAPHLHLVPVGGRVGGWETGN